MFTALQTKVPLAPLARLIRSSNVKNVVGSARMLKVESTSDRSMVRTSTQTRSLFTTKTNNTNTIQNTKKNSLYNTTLTATVFVMTSNDTSVIVSTRDYARWAKTMKMMPKDKLKQMLDQQKKASGVAVTGETTTPTDGSTPAATPTSGSAGAAYSQQRKIKVYMDATGKVADPWKPGDATGLWSRFKRSMSTNIFAGWRIRSMYKKKQFGTFDKTKFVSECLDVYQKFNKQVASGNWNDMGDYAGLAVIEDVRNEFGGRKLNPEYQYNWECAQLDASIVNLVVIQVPAPLNKTFLQATLKVTSKQELKILSRDGKFLGGSREPADVTDYFVFERSLDMKEAPVILIGRLRDQKKE
eukprot:TRINITY_DN8359_c0_g1_i1.p1 TRINITY_DN8359_c0_g1~~TRINITY_DN8359_c0_g1_i1.p1  ORF type:complete len:356 (-),score=81.74 TRINITY_DN8359_c0_g1_i1:42-1109(-)